MPWSSGTSSGSSSPGQVGLTSATKTAKRPAAASSHSPEDSTPTVAFALSKPDEPTGQNTSNKTETANSPEGRPASKAAAARPPVLDWEAWRARTGGVDGRPAAEDAAPSA